MSKSKQTAVEWLENRLLNNDDILTTVDFEILTKVIQQAKEMEKKQIIDFGEEIIDHLCYGAQPRSWIEEKYNEVYGKDKSES